MCADPASRPAFVLRVDCPYTTLTVRSLPALIGDVGFATSNNKRAAVVSIILSLCVVVRYLPKLYLLRSDGECNVDSIDGAAADCCSTKKK